MQFLLKMHRPVLFVPVFFLFSLLLPSCKAYKDVEVKDVTEVRFVQMSDEGIELEVYMLIDNPNAFKITLTNSDVDLFFESKALGRVELLHPLTIPKHSSSVQMMKIRTTYGSIDNITGNIFDLLFKKEFTIQAKGFVTGKVLFVKRKVAIDFTEIIPRDELGF